MATDFSKLLRKPAGEAKKPPALPMGHYPAVIKSYELDDKNKNNTPYVQFNIGYMGWPDDTDESDKTFDGKPIDLSKRGGRVQYFLTDDALWRLDEFLVSIGSDPKGRSYEEVLPETTGTVVIAVVVPYMNKQTGEVGAVIDKVIASD